jgi:hypothetical protein
MEIHEPHLVLSQGGLWWGAQGCKCALVLALPHQGVTSPSLCYRRFHHSLTDHHRWIRERSHESYTKNYSVVFPHDEPLAGRNMRKDPLHEVPQGPACRATAPSGRTLGYWGDRSTSIVPLPEQCALGAVPGLGEWWGRWKWLCPGASMLVGRQVPKNICGICPDTAAVLEVGGRCMASVQSACQMGAADHRLLLVVGLACSPTLSFCLHDRCPV